MTTRYFPGATSVEIPLRDTDEVSHWRDQHASPYSSN